MADMVETSATAEEILKHDKEVLEYENAFNGPHKDGINWHQAGESFKAFMGRTSDTLKKFPLWKKNFISPDGEYYPPTMVRENVCRDIRVMGTAMAHGAGVALKYTVKGAGFALGAAGAGAKEGILAGYEKLSAKFPTHRRILGKNAETAGWEYLAVREYINSATKYTADKNLAPTERAALMDTIKLTEGVRNAYYNRIAYEHYGVAPGKNAPAFLKQFLDMQCAANIDITSDKCKKQYDKLVEEEMKKAIKSGDYDAVKRLMPPVAEKPVSQVLDEVQAQASKTNEQIAEENKTFSLGFGHGDFMQVRNSRGEVCQKKPVFLEIGPSGNLLLVDANGKAVNAASYLKFHEQHAAQQEQAKAPVVEKPVEKPVEKVSAEPTASKGDGFTITDNATGKSMNLTAEEYESFRHAMADTQAQEMEEAEAVAKEAAAKVTQMPKTSGHSVRNRGTKMLKGQKKREALFGKDVPSKVEDAPEAASSGAEMSK